MSLFKEITTSKKRPYMIAEMSGNHNHSLERALQIVQAAADSGADAIKLQTYRADTITLNSHAEDFLINDKNSLWHGRNLYDLYEEAHTPWEWHKPIMDKAAELGIDCFSSPFDFEAVDFLESLNVPAYKIASFEATHLPLIAKVAATGKPVIISTGNANESEIKEAVETCHKAGNKQVTLLKCTSQYPADASDANLATMSDLHNKFGCEIGLSDHTLGSGVAILASHLGATVIEKHFTLSRADGGVDSDFSMQPEEFKQMILDCERATLAFGKIHYAGTKNEQSNKKFRQSLWTAKAVEKGEKFTPENLVVRRPSTGGLEPKYYEKVLGKNAKQNLAAFHKITLEDFS